MPGIIAIAWKIPIVNACSHPVPCALCPMSCRESTNQFITPEIMSVMPTQNNEANMLSKRSFKKYPANPAGIVPIINIHIRCGFLKVSSSQTILL